MGDSPGKVRSAAAPEVAAVVLLAGGLKPSPLVAAVGRSVLDLSITRDRTLLDLWVSALDGPLWPSVRAPVVHVVCGGSTADPRPPAAATGVEVRIERDRKSYRGPAGAVRDVTEHLPDEACVLVAEGHRTPLDAVDDFLLAHAEGEADVSVAVNPDGSPAGVYAVRRGALRHVPANGFMDLKEQWLNRAMGAGVSVRAVRVAPPGSMPLRTREQFLIAAKVVAGRSEGGALPECTIFDLGGANETEPFSVLARGSCLGQGAVVVDSVVMPEADVGPGAVVVRSLVCPGAKVQPGAEVVDAIVTPAGVVSDGVLAG